jgi:predicted transcriptional regulator
MPRPKRLIQEKTLSGETKLVAVRFPVEDLRRLDFLAKKERTDRSTVIRQAVAKKLYPELK